MKEILSVKVDQELKDEVVRISEEQGISKSEFCRNLLNESLEFDEDTKTFYDEDDAPPVIGSRIVVTENGCYDITNSEKELPLAVLFLFVNLYSTNFYNKQNLESAKTYLENLSVNPTFSNELRSELLKALNDIKRVLSMGISDTSLNFTRPYNMYTLNFNLLYTEVYNLINRGYRDEK